MTREKWKFEIETSARSRRKPANPLRFWLGLRRPGHGFARRAILVQDTNIVKGSRGYASTDERKTAAHHSDKELESLASFGLPSRTLMS